MVLGLQFFHLDREMGVDAVVLPLPEESFASFVGHACGERGGLGGAWSARGAADLAHG